MCWTGLILLSVQHVKHVAGPTVPASSAQLSRGQSPPGRPLQLIWCTRSHNISLTSIRILYTCNILYFGPQYLHNTTSCTFVFPIFVSVSFITFCSLTDPFSLNISSCLLSAMQLLSGYLTDFLERLSATTDAYKHYKMYVRSAWGRSYNWNVCLF